MFMLLSSGAGESLPASPTKNVGTVPYAAATARVQCLQAFAVNLVGQFPQHEPVREAVRLKCRSLVETAVGMSMGGAALPLPPTARAWSRIQ